MADDESSGGEGALPPGCGGVRIETPEEMACALRDQAGIEARILA